jgi:hypothetical protein
LQIHIKQTTVQIAERADENKKFQDSIIAENSSLQDEVRKMRELCVQKDK